MATSVKTDATVEISGRCQYLTFSLGGEMYAIDILAIKEIIEYGTVTSVPMMPDCIRGVINLRGAVVPVVDLHARFGRRITSVTKRTCVVIVEVESDKGRQVMGVMVDAVSAVLEIHGVDIEPAPAFGTKIRTDFIRGMGKVDGRFAIILDLRRVLSPDDLAMQSHAVDSGKAEVRSVEVEDVAA